MIARCTPGSPDRERYFDRGIRVCLEWQGIGGYYNFLAHVGPKPASDLSIDRIDNDRGYEPGNVRWATYQEQALNTTRN